MTVNRVIFASVMQISTVKPNKVYHEKLFLFSFFVFMLSFFKRSLGHKVQLWIICASSWADKNEEKKYERTVFRVKGGTKTVLVFGKIVIKHPAKNNEKSHRQEFQLTMANKASGTHSVS